MAAKAIQLVPNGRNGLFGQLKGKESKMTLSGQGRIWPPQIGADMRKRFGLTFIENNCK